MTCRRSATISRAPIFGRLNPQKVISSFTTSPAERAATYRVRGGRQAYFAIARIVEVRPDLSRADHFYADVNSYLDFPNPVPFREGLHYYEFAVQRDDGATNKGAFGRAVRSLPEDEYDAIFKAGFASVLAATSAGLLGPRFEGGFMEPPATFERPIIERVINRPFREAAFSGSIKSAYDDTCAFTGLKIINGGGRSEVQAAHIRPVMSSGPDFLRNGIALCGTVHWMFDRGLISIADNHELLVARGKVPQQVMRLLNPDRRVLVPPRAEQIPHPIFLRWHRENVFKG